MKSIILIPAYEPDNHLIKLLKQIDKDEFDVIVVDDGSGKDYLSIFDEAREYANVIQYDINRGKGYALKTGFKYIKEHYSKDYIVITMDSDGQHKLSDAKKLVSYVVDNLDTLVLGMRKRDEKVPLRSKIGNSITKAIYGLVTGVHVYDTQTGLRVFSYKLMDDFLSIDGDRFEYEMKVLLYCARMNIPIYEIPIQTIYIENNRHSHFKTFRDSFYIYKEILKFSFSSILSFFVDYILYCILFMISSSLIISNVVARIISSSFNYIMNRKFVFCSDNSRMKSVVSYALLAIFILICNTFLLYLLIDKLFFNKFGAKFIVELLLFFVSWSVQKNIIFKKRG